MRILAQLMLRSGYTCGKFNAVASKTYSLGRRTDKRAKCIIIAIVEFSLPGIDDSESCLVTRTIIIAGKRCV